MTEKYPWYEIVEESEELEQGDFIDDCEVLIPTYISDEIESNSSTNTRKFKATGISRIHNVVIISQSCTLENGRSDDHVLLCPRRSYTEYVQHFLDAGRNMKSIQANLEQIRLGRQYRYCLLNECNLPDLTCEIQIVELGTVFSIPYDIMKQMAKSSGNRIRLLSPFKEYLAQAYGYFHMRVALPNSIPEFVKPKAPIPVGSWQLPR